MKFLYDEDETLYNNNRCCGSAFFGRKGSNRSDCLYAGVDRRRHYIFLPATSLRVVLTATKTHHTPGEFCEYAERYLRLKDVPQTAYDTWTIDDVKIVPYGVADKSKAYSIKFKQKTSAPYVSLTNDGRLLSVNAKSSVNDEQLPVASVTKVQQKTVNGADFKTEEILSAGSTAKWQNWLQTKYMTFAKTVVC